MAFENIVVSAPVAHSAGDTEGERNIRMACHRYIHIGAKRSIAARQRLFPFNPGIAVIVAFLIDLVIYRLFYKMAHSVVGPSGLNKMKEIKDLLAEVRIHGLFQVFLTDSACSCLCLILLGFAVCNYYGLPVLHVPCIPVFLMAVIKILVNIANGVIVLRMCIEYHLRSCPAVRTKSTDVFHQCSGCIGINKAVGYIQHKIVHSRRNKQLKLLFDNIRVTAVIIAVERFAPEMLHVVGAYAAFSLKHLIGAVFGDDLGNIVYIPHGASVETLRHMIKHSYRLFLFFIANAQGYSSVLIYGHHILDIVAV